MLALRAVVKEVRLAGLFYPARTAAVLDAILALLLARLAELAAMIADC